MNDRLDISGAHISFEIDSSPSRQGGTGQTWIEMPNLPNASETAPYGVGFHPLQADPMPNSFQPSARQGDGTGIAPVPGLPAPPGVATPLPPALHSSEPSPRPQRPPTTDARRGRTTSPIPPLKPSLPPVHRYSALSPQAPVPPPAAPEAATNSEAAALSDVPDLLRQWSNPSADTEKPAKASRKVKPRRVTARELWTQAGRTTQTVVQKVGDRLPPPSALAHGVGYLGRAARRSWQRSWVPALWLGILALSSGMGAIAFLTLSHQPPAPDCKQLSALSADIDQLYCAQQAAESGNVADLVAGISLVQSWSEEHPLHREAQGMLTGWSKELLKIASDKFDQSDLYGAIEIANHIPRTSSVYADAQQAIADWQSEWQEGENIYKATEDAIKSQDWQLANEKLLDLGRLRHAFWRQQQADYLAQRILTEKQAWQVLEQARKLAATNKLTQIGEAIALVDRISSKTFVWEVAQADQERWSRSLLTVGMQRWQEGNVNVAIDLIRQIPLSTDKFPESKDLILYSHAQYLAKSTQNQAWMPTLQQIWNLNVAIAAARQIEPESPLYVEAQSQAQAWQKQIEDALDLKVADWFADMGQRSTYELAIEQASQVGSDRPRRVQAQTLVAHWKLEIERLEDRPILDRAYRMAGQQTIPMLQAAIAEASQVQQGRALRVEAQTSIAHWRLKIERIEDQPLLDEAIALADQGRLSEAIQAAQRIKQNRALYAEAQALAADWQYTLDNAAIAEDRSILDEAYGYAQKEWYSVAIDIASRIQPGRPLYDEAQAAIANWKDARAAIWRTRGQSSDSSSDDDSYEGYYSPDEGR